MLRTGYDVYDVNGNHVGTVNEVGSNYVLVQKGTFFPRDVYIPMSAIQRSDDNALWISVDKDSIDSQGWDAAPTLDSADYAKTAADYGKTRIPVHEEELEARKTTRQAGEVQVRKDVYEEGRTMDVPVTREEVNVRRHPVDRPATDAEATFAEGTDTFRVPVMEEDVEVTKRPRVKEEIEIEKVAHQDTERVDGTVRREEVKVSGKGTENLR